MQVSRLFRPALAGLLFLGASAALAQRLALLDMLQPGEWSLHEIGVKGDPRMICVRDPRLLLQVRHGTSTCARFVVENDARSATIHYTCPGLGHGRTTITIESAGIARLHTQGIAESAPFDIDYEARRAGTCR